MADLSASFQKAAIGALIKQTHKAYLQLKPRALVVGGGVAANSYLREKILDIIPNAIFVPPILCTDNAAMIGALAYQKYQKGQLADPFELNVDSSLEVI